jgi:hypothetical protein
MVESSTASRWVILVGACRRGRCGHRPSRFWVALAFGWGGRRLQRPWKAGNSASKRVPTLPVSPRRVPDAGMRRVTGVAATPCVSRSRAALPRPSSSPGPVTPSRTTHSSTLALPPASRLRTPRTRLHLALRQRAPLRDRQRACACTNSPRVCARNTPGRRPRPGRADRRRRKLGRFPGTAAGNV